MARRAVSAKAGEVELVERRSLTGKVFQDSSGQFRLSTKIAPQHWDDGGTWVEVDDTPVSDDGGRTWRTVSTPYILNWDAETLTLSYQSKKGGDVTVRLAALDGVAFGGKPSATTVSGQDIIVTVAPELEIDFRIRSHGVEIYKILHGPNAPRSLTWEVIEGDISKIICDPMTTKGRDNLLYSDARKLDDPMNRRRSIELTHDRTPDDLSSNPGKKTYTVTETFTGKTRFVDPNTMARSFVNEVEYPIEIDVSINEHIVSTNDDGGSGATPYWQSNVILMGYGTNYAAVRFQTVAVPQGATINSAVITVNVTGSAGAATWTFKGENVDSAGLWTQSPQTYTSPETMAATTASVTLSALGVGTGKTITVTSIVQEIVNRAGWASGNHMRFGTTTSASGVTYMRWEDYEAAGTNEAQLDITYTAAGGSTSRIRFPSQFSAMGVGGVLGGNRIN